MAEAYLKRIIKVGSSGEAFAITGTTDLNGIYQETITAGDPVYRSLEPGVNGDSN